MAICTDFLFGAQRDRHRWVKEFLGCGSPYGVQYLVSIYDYDDGWALIDCLTLDTNTSFNVMLIFLDFLGFSSPSLPLSRHVMPSSLEILSAPDHHTTIPLSEDNQHKTALAPPICQRPIPNGYRSKPVYWFAIVPLRWAYEKAQGNTPRTGAWEFQLRRGGRRRKVVFLHDLAGLRRLPPKRSTGLLGC